MSSDSIKPHRPQASGNAIHCHDCSMGALCIPFTLSNDELNKLDVIIERKKPIQKGDILFKSG